MILGRTKIKDSSMTNIDEGEVTFPVRGIFGVGRLATKLKTLADGAQIGPWHIGQWINFRHTAIRVRFASAADGEVARLSTGSASSAGVQVPRLGVETCR